MKAKNTIKTDAAFRRMVDEVAQLMPAMAAKKAELEAKLQAVREEPEAELAAMKADYDAKMAALKNYFASDKVQARLLTPGKKYGESTAATFGVRAGKPKLGYLDGKTEADIVAALQEEERTEWLRDRAPELNKAAILGAGLSEDELQDYGLTITAADTFYVKPKDAPKS